MMEAEVEEHLQKLRRSLERIKALAAWQQLKHQEASPRRISAFQMPDSTEEELKNEYALCVALLVGLRSVLTDHSFNISKTRREHLSRQLGDIDQDIHTLDPQRSSRGLGR